MYETLEASEKGIGSTENRVMIRRTYTAKTEQKKKTLHN